VDARRADRIAYIRAWADRNKTGQGTRRAVVARGVESSRVGSGRVVCCLRVVAHFSRRRPGSSQEQGARLSRQQLPNAARLTGRRPVMCRRRAGLWDACRVWILQLAVGVVSMIHEQGHAWIREESDASPGALVDTRSYLPIVCNVFVFVSVDAYKHMRIQQTKTKTAGWRVRSSGLGTKMAVQVHELFMHLLKDDVGYPGRAGMRRP
jgi:hypothetical protein